MAARFLKNFPNPDRLCVRCSDISLTVVLALAEVSPLPRVKHVHDDPVSATPQQGSCHASTLINPDGAGSNVGVVVENNSGSGSPAAIKKVFMFFEPKGCLKERDDYSLYLFPPHNR
jgi:hypothetical protein